MLRTEAKGEGTGGWIESRGYDLSFFILSPLVGLAYLLAVWGGVATAALVAATLIGIPHYLSTFAFFFWEENRAWHRARWIAFYVTPLLIGIALFGAAEAGLWVLVQLVTFVWNAYHVARQSCGIASLYRHRAGVTESEHRWVANGAVLATSAACLAFGLRNHPRVRDLFERVHPAVPDVLLWAAVAAALFFLAHLTASFLRRARAGHGPRLPELGALATGLLLFHPYLWFADSERATLALLLGHFVQYLGLVWLLHRRKFGSGQPSSSPSWLQRISSSLPLLVSVAVLSGVLFLSMQFLSSRMEVLGSFNVLFVLLTYTHFHLDGLFWSFRDPHVRQTLGPVLSGPR